MTVAEFRQIADTELSARGLRKHKLPSFSTPVYAAEFGEVVRYFGPHAMRRPWGCVLLGTFGIHVPALRDWLGTSGHEPCAAGLGYYMTNGRQFMSPASVVSEADLPAMRDWFDAIHARVLSLPASVQDLAALSDSEPDHLTLLRESVPAFWDAFTDWSGR